MVLPLKIQSFNKTAHGICKCVSQKIILIDAAKLDVLSTFKHNRKREKAKEKGLHNPLIH